MGTLGFRAPEVAAGIYGPEADVYSLGVLLFCCAALQLPRDFRPADENWTPLADCAVVDALVRACCAEPAKRPRAADVYRNLGTATLLSQPLASVNEASDSFESES